MPVSPGPLGLLVPLLRERQTNSLGHLDLQGGHGPCLSQVLDGQLAACRRHFSLPGNDKRSLKLHGSAIASAPRGSISTLITTVMLSARQYDFLLCKQQ